MHDMICTCMLFLVLEKLDGWVSFVFTAEVCILPVTGTYCESHYQGGGGALQSIDNTNIVSTLAEIVTH